VEAHIHDRIVTPDTDPDRWTAEETAIFRAGNCPWQTAYGTGYAAEYCEAPSEPRWQDNPRWDREPGYDDRCDRAATLWALAEASA
jgi:hypothetical protein